MPETTAVTTIKNPQENYNKQTKTSKKPKPKNKKKEKQNKQKTKTNQPKNTMNQQKIKDALPLLHSDMSPLSLGKTYGYIEVNKATLNPFSTVWIVENMDAGSGNS